MVQFVDNATQKSPSLGAELQACLNLIPAHAWCAGASGALTFMNERGSDYIGLPKNHPLRLGLDIGAAWDSDIPFLHPDDHEETHRVWSTCLKKGCAGQVSFRVRNANGVYRWFLSRAGPVRSNDGTLLYWIGVNLDINDQKQAEFHLAKRPRTAHLGSWTFTAGRFDDWSCESFGPNPNRKSASAELDLAPQAMSILGPTSDRSSANPGDRKRAEDGRQQENVAIREEIGETCMFDGIVGTSPALQSVLSRISKVAPSDSTVLITGETGTGKELIARAIHRRSTRGAGAFVSVNCAAIPRDLILSELFGHEKGAFTGATQRRVGRFELADRGTIFLDEVGELSPDTQIALLRVLQEREFERVGGSQSRHVNVRVIAATNLNLKAAVSNGTFRQDLFYRLNVFPVEVPALRERKQDILMLTEYFVQRYAKRAGKNLHAIDKKTLGILQSYEWPGNIRELQNVVERSVILGSGEIFSIDEGWLSKETLPPQVGVDAKPEGEPRTERAIIEAALAEAKGRISGPSGAAVKLGVPPSTLDHKIKALQIDKWKFKFR